MNAVKQVNLKSASLILIGTAEVIVRLAMIGDLARRARAETVIVARPADRDVSDLFQPENRLKRMPREKASSFL